MTDGLDRLKVLINSSTHIVVMETSEEMHAVNLVRNACSQLNMGVRVEHCRRPGSIWQQCARRSPEANAAGPHRSSHRLDPSQHRDARATAHDIESRRQ